MLKHFKFLGKHGSENFTFWLEYLNMVGVLLNLLSVGRNGNWQLYLEILKQMLFYNGAYDHQIYFKWETIYLIHMKRLPTTHLDLQDAFMIGFHSVSCKEPQQN